MAATLRKQKPSPLLPNPDDIQLPAATDWRTTDQDEINRRILRAREEKFGITNLSLQYPIFSDFEVASQSGMTYAVEIHSVAQRRFHCTCVDFQVNQLGTCKHVEAVLAHLAATRKKPFAAAVSRDDSPRIDLVADTAGSALVVTRNLDKLPAPARACFDKTGRAIIHNASEIDDILAKLGVAAANQADQSDRSDQSDLSDPSTPLAPSALPSPPSPRAHSESFRNPHSAIRISHSIPAWRDKLRRDETRLALRRDYEQKVRSGEYPPHETLVPLYPYQREGMLHLAFGGRALLADEMGLGKTIQAIAAAALLHRLGHARRVLIVTPASLKTEWEEQIRRFTPLPLQIVYGTRRARLAAYDAAPFFTLVNYEQMRADALDVNARLRPDIIILDEAQRIKNWASKTAQAIKRLRSPYAFVLTGTPIENRLDELYSIISFLDPAIFGPLFHFNREYYDLDARGRPEYCRSLARVHERIRPLLLRRRKTDVETELPDRTDRNLYIDLTPAQRTDYAAHAAVVAKLLYIAKRRPLTKQQQEKLLLEMGMMRMLCDTPYILDKSPKPDRTCPKLDELSRLLDDLLDDSETNNAPAANAATNARATTAPISGSGNARVSRADEPRPAVRPIENPSAPASGNARVPRADETRPESRQSPAKIIIFSEWVRMLELIRDHLRKRRIGHAWHTGSVPQRQRRAEIRLFKDDPRCRVFLSTDSGGVGLNLQNASVVINCDLPWNPAKLEQRIARAWRKHQKNTVTVINLIARDTIEHGMLGTLAAKQSLAEGVLDLRGDLEHVPLRPSGQTFFQRLEQILSKDKTSAAIAAGAAGATQTTPTIQNPLYESASGLTSKIQNLPDPGAALAQAALALLPARIVACEERYPLPSDTAAATAGADFIPVPPVLVLVVDRDAETLRPHLETLREKLFPAPAPTPTAATTTDIHAGAAAPHVEPVASLETPFSILHSTLARSALPRLEVIDRATAQTLERLREAGIIQTTTRGTRILYSALAPDGTAATASTLTPPAPPPLTPDEKTRADSHRAQAAKRLRLAKMLLEEDLSPDAAQALAKSAHELANAFAIETRAGLIPRTLADIYLPPLNHLLDAAFLTLARPLADSTTAATIAATAAAAATETQTLRDLAKSLENHLDAAAPQP